MKKYVFALTRTPEYMYIFSENSVCACSIFVQVLDAQLTPEPTSLTVIQNLRCKLGACHDGPHNCL